MESVAKEEKMNENRLQSGEISKTLKFPATSGFGRWEKFFPEGAKEHPAKMNLNLLNYLILNYTEEGDTVLDCMSGSGSTGVLSALNGRNAILIELEEKFCGWIREAVKRVERQQTINEKGKIVVIQGDARNIPTLLKEHSDEISAVITSPPYSLGHDSGDNASEEYSERLKEQRKHTRAYSSGNIAKMPLGLDEGINCTLFSPPYSSSLKGSQSDENCDRHATWIEKYGKAGNFHTRGRLRSHKVMGSRYSDSKANIGNLGYASVDDIITSPPYESSLEGGSRHTKGGIASRDPKMAQAGTYATTMSFGVPVGYSANDANIENLKSSEDEYAELSKNGEEEPVKEAVKNESETDAKKNNTQENGKETYLTAMRAVYAGCFEVLKPEGRMIIVVKNFIRNKELVPLSEHTIRLCQSVGFSLEEHLLFKLPKTSFWRVLNKKRWEEEGREFPEDLSYEHVLVFRK